MHKSANVLRERRHLDALQVEHSNAGVHIPLSSNRTGRKYDPLCPLPPKGMERNQSLYVTSVQQGRQVELTQQLVVHGPAETVRFVEEVGVVRLDLQVRGALRVTSQRGHDDAAIRTQDGYAIT